MVLYEGRSIADVARSIGVIEDTLRMERDLLKRSLAASVKESTS